MTLDLFQVDAFTTRVFHGNPAAVCPLSEWPDDELLQQIAAENNLAETAFFCGGGGTYELRWFTPSIEVQLCGHATLASAFVLFNEMGESSERIRFDTKSGPLRAERASEGIAMDFPRFETAPCPDPPRELLEGLGSEPTEVFTTPRSTNYFAVYGNEAEVQGLRPDFDRLERLHPYGVVVTAPGIEADCASRYFAPSYGIREDPVTGSIHCGLTPYWSDRLGRERIRAVQVSRRGGEIFCTLKRDRVELRGEAVLYLRGRITV